MNKLINLFLLIVLSISDAADIKFYDEGIGSNCLQADGKNGTCVALRRCMDAIGRLQLKEKPEVCSFQGRDPVVCCSDCELINDPESVLVNDYGGFYLKTGSKAYDKCLEYMVSLPYSCPMRNALFPSWQFDRLCYEYEAPTVVPAVGGQDAQRDQYPHMALLGYGSDVQSAQWLCGGSLISDRFILTAGHCTASSLGQVAYVALGILKRTDPPRLWQSYRVDKIILHPQYKPPIKYHDIALLRTEKQIKFGPSVLPACLHAGDIGRRDTGAYATGWGAQGFRKQLADTLQTVMVKKFEEDECKKQYPVHRLLPQGYDVTSQLCYGDEVEVKDTCEGDSGGPLSVPSRHADCLHVVVGVTSYGRACGFRGNAGVYSRVNHYVPWIEGIVWQ